MSSVSFSHEFYKHWMHTPQPVQAVLVQELTDIIDFLQTDATFENFDFSVDNIDAHLDDLYHKNNAPKLSQAPTIKQQQTEKAPLLTADTTTQSGADNHDQPATINTVLKQSAVNPAHEALVHELSQHLDDYLSEQMAQISEDLKSWLRSEIRQKLAEQAQMTAKQ